MKKIFMAETIEEAKALAAEEFGVNVEKIVFSILEEPKKSLFGKVKSNAKVEAEYDFSKAEIAANYIKKCVVKMGLEEPTIEITETDNGGALLDISGKDIEDIIGRRGESLDGLQYLSSLVCNKGDKDYYRITLDCNGFRAKRKTQLEDLAKKIASNVKRSGRSSTLEPMNPYERRIIHAAITEIEGVTSNSVGEEPYRKVVISSTEKRPDRRNRDGKRNPKKKERVLKPLDMSTSFEKDYKKPRPEDSIETGLYSKIEF